MAPRLDELTDALARALADAYAYVAQPWFIYQALIVLALFAVARLLAVRIVPRLERRARSIKGNPGLLRIVIALMRRTDWILFCLTLFCVLTLLRALTWPSRSLLVSLVLSLSLVWLSVSVLSRIIRNRLAARTVAWAIWLYAALVITGLDDRAADLLERVALPIGTYQLTALVVLKAAVVLTAVLWVAVLAGNLLDQRVQRLPDLTPSMRVLIGKVLKITLLLVGGAVGLSAVGVNLTTLTIFSGAIGLGIGFGLQKVVSNFISGIIILLDKSIKPGDTITVGDTFGWTRELRGRFVSVITRDGKEYLIPNEDFITQRVINWSFSDDLVRLDVKFGVSYDSDPHVVSDLAIKAAMSVPRVEADRRPVCWLTGFGESSLDFVLRFWIHDPQQGLTNVRGKVLLALWDSFRDNGISIPYPHREIILKDKLAQGAPRGSGAGLKGEA
jgi:small-conductance mechanosensitive channel